MIRSRRLRICWSNRKRRQENRLFVSSGIDAEHPEDRFFFVAAVATGVDTNGRKLAALAPAFDGEGRNAEESGDFGDGKKIGEIRETQFLFLFSV